MGGTGDEDERTSILGGCRLFGDLQLCAVTWTVEK